MTEIIAEQPIGQNRAKWNGGMIWNNGYCYVYNPSHPNKNAVGSGYVKRSRLVMEGHLGRYLERHEFVHHVNGDRGDDRLENLKVTDHSTHQSHHQKETAKMMIRDSSGRFLRKGETLCQ